MEYISQVMFSNRKLMYANKYVWVGCPASRNPAHCIASAEIPMFGGFLRFCCSSRGHLQHWLVCKVFVHAVQQQCSQLTSR